MVQRELVVDLKDRGGVVDVWSQPVRVLRLKVSLDHVDIDAEGPVELISVRDHNARAEGADQLARCRVVIQVRDHLFFLVLLLFRVPLATNWVVIARLVKFTLKYVVLVVFFLSYSIVRWMITPAVVLSAEER